MDFYVFECQCLHAFREVYLSSTEFIPVQLMMITIAMHCLLFHLVVGEMG